MTRATLDYLFPQHIGVYYKDTEWMTKAYDVFYRYFPDGWIKLGRLLQHGAKIELIDGTTIDFVLATSAVRGRRFSKVLIQPGISEEFIDRAIMPALTHISIRANELEVYDD